MVSAASVYNVAVPEVYNVAVAEVASSRGNQPAPLIDPFAREQAKLAPPCRQARRSLGGNCLARVVGVESPRE